MASHYAEIYGNIYLCHSEELTTEKPDHSPPVPGREGSMLCSIAENVRVLLVKEFRLGQCKTGPASSLLVIFIQQIILGNH